MGKLTPPFPLVWTWTTRMPERVGQRCRMLVKARMWSCLLEFDDGHRVVTDQRGARPHDGKMRQVPLL